MKPAAFAGAFALVALVALLLASAAARAGVAPPDVARATLSNGLQVIAVRQPLAPVVTTVVVYKVGAEEDPAGMPGMAHAQEHMLFRGSLGLSAEQLGEISAAMGGDSDAFTEAADTQYYYTVPAEDLDVVLHLEASRMADVTDAAADWANERGAIEQEVARDRSDPEYVVTAAARAAMFAGTPDADDGLGTKASFDAMTADQIKRFYQTWYGPDDAVLVAAGDLDPRATIAQVRRLFSSIPRRMHPPLPSSSPPAPAGAEITLQGDQPHPNVFVAYRMPGFDSPDYAAGVVLSDVLSDDRSDLHWFPPNWANGVGFWSDTFPAGGMGFAAASIPAGAQADRMVKVLKNNIDDYITDGFPKRDVEAAKRRALVRLESDRGSIPDLALAWARAVAVLGEQTPDEEIAQIQKVTVDDVDRVAGQYLKSDDAIVGTLLASPAGTVAANSAPVKSSESVLPVVARTAPSLPDWANPAIAMTAPRSGLAPVDQVLPNGLRLIVQPEAAADTVAVRGFVAGNPALETPPGKDGVEQLLAEIFAEGPADVVDEDWMAELDGTGADLTAGRAMSIDMLASDFDHGIQLLADNELHPNITPAFFNRRRDEIASAVADDLAGPDAQAQNSTLEGLFPLGDPERRVPTKDSIGGLSFADVDDYYTRAFRPDLTTIVIVGDVTPAAARATVVKYFGAWTAQPPRPVMALPGVPPNAAATTVVPALGHVQDDVSLEELVGVGRSDPDYYPLQLADHVLAGGDDATWLFRDVRQDAGLAYSIDSTFVAADGGRSIFSIEYGCDPANVSKAKDIVLRDLRELQSRRLAADDMRRAKLLLLRRVPLGEQSEQRIADGLLARAVAGIPLDEPVRAARRYLAIKPEQVRRAFARWIRPDGFVEVVEGPPPQ
jgi:zinc protease